MYYIQQNRHTFYNMNTNNSTNKILNYSNKPNRFKCLEPVEEPKQRIPQRVSNSFLTNKPTKNTFSNNIKTNCINECDFPNLCTNLKQQPIVQQLPNAFSFKAAVGIQEDDIVTPNKCDNNVEPGWVQIHSVNKQTIFKYGPTLPHHNNNNNNNNDDKEYDMNHAITLMSTNWEQYKTNYDEINGEGMYDDIHYLSPSYEDTSETETELDNDSEYSE
jgi:hypothetical protein